MSKEIFKSCTRIKDDLAGVFEYDGETGYFYLYAAHGNAGNKILTSIHITSEEVDFLDSDVAIRWNSIESKVGLFIRDILWAVLDADALHKYGGGYKIGANPPSSLKFFKGF